MISISERQLVWIWNFELPSPTMIKYGDNEIAQIIKKLISDSIVYDISKTKFTRLLLAHSRKRGNILENLLRPWPSQADFVT